MADTSKSAAAGTPSGTGPNQGPDPLLGRTVNDRFRIISMIARGGMGKVYKAEQAPLGRICAVKVLNPNYAGDNDPEFHKRFFLEASIASKLSHPNTVTIFDYGRTDDDVYYMAMEYLEGRTLHRLIRDEAPLDPARVIHITRQACRSLREAHGLGVIHRDLKPANIYLIKHDEEDDFVKVLDFGLVKNVDDTSENLTQTGLFMGSPKYMAPEQIRGERVTARTDVYAMGVVMFEMLTGKVPFDRGNSVNTLMAHVSDPVPAMREVAPTALVPQTLEEVVYKCLEKRPEDRYASMDEMLAALKRVGAQTFGERAGIGTGEYHSGASGNTGEVPSTSAEIRVPHPVEGASGPGSTIGSRSGSGPQTMDSISTSGAQRMSNPLDMTPGPDLGNTPFAMSLPAPAAKKSSTGPIVGGVLVLALLAAGAFVMLRPTNNGATGGSQATAASSVGTGGLHDTTPTPPAPTGVHVALDSTPPGAEVYEGSTLLGRTPLRLDWTGEQGDATRSHTFTFRAPTFRETQVTLSGSNLTHLVQLESAPAVPETPPAVAPTPNQPARGTRPVVRTARPRPGTHAPAGYREVPW